VNENETLRNKIIEVLKTIMDPEVPINIYDLGLIYNVEVDSNNNVHIQMTLTTSRCPMAAFLPQQVENTVRNIPEVKEVIVKMVWDPPWTTDRMSDSAKQQLGIKK
jgi:FeS assembly SUF system protein